MSLLSSLWLKISRYLPEYFPLQLCVIYFLWSLLWSQPSILLFDFLSFCLHRLVCMSDSLETLSLIEHSNSVFYFQSKLITYFLSVHIKALSLKEEIYRGHIFILCFKALRPFYFPLPFYPLHLVCIYHC